MIIELTADNFVVATERFRDIAGFNKGGFGGGCRWWLPFPLSLIGIRFPLAIIVVIVRFPFPLRCCRSRCCFSYCPAMSIALSNLT